MPVPTDPSSKLGRMNDIASLAARVFAPDALLLVIVHVGKVDGRMWCSVSSARRHPNDANGVGWRHLGGLGKERRKKVGEKEVAKVVEAERQLVALDRFGALRRNHDASVIPEDVEARLLGEELLGRCLDRGQVVELELKEEHLAVRRRVSLLNLVHDFLSLGGGPRGDPDLRMVLIEDIDEFRA